MSTPVRSFTLKILKNDNFVDLVGIGGTIGVADNWVFPSEHFIASVVDGIDLNHLERRVIGDVLAEHVDELVEV